MTGDNVEFTLMQRAGSEMPPYQRLLGDAMRGNSELFGREDTVDAQWRIVEPILKNPPPVQEYEPGTWGPDAANALIGADGPWRNPARAQGLNSAAFDILAQSRSLLMSRIAFRSGRVRPRAPRLPPAHDLGKLGALFKLSCVDPGDRCNKPAAAVQKLVGELDHSRVWPRLRPDCNSRSASPSSFSSGRACARIISVAAVERDMPHGNE